jgi:hypothetical protein
VIPVFCRIRWHVRVSWCERRGVGSHQRGPTPRFQRYAEKTTLTVVVQTGRLRGLCWCPCSVQRTISPDLALAVDAQVTQQIQRDTLQGFVAMPMSADEKSSKIERSKSKVGAKIKGECVGPH